MLLAPWRLWKVSLNNEGGLGVQSRVNSPAAYHDVFCQSVSQSPCTIATVRLCLLLGLRHDDVIKWIHFPRYWPFVSGIHQSPVNSPHKGQWHRALMFSLICAWINSWVNNGEPGDLKCHHAHYDVTVMQRDCEWKMVAIPAGHVIPQCLETAVFPKLFRSANHKPAIPTSLIAHWKS